MKGPEGSAKLHNEGLCGCIRLIWICRWFLPIIKPTQHDLSCFMVVWGVAITYVILFVIFKQAWWQNLDIVLDILTIWVRLGIIWVLMGTIEVLLCTNGVLWVTMDVLFGTIEVLLCTMKLHFVLWRYVCIPTGRFFFNKEGTFGDQEGTFCTMDEYFEVLSGINGVLLVNMLDQQKFDKLLLRKVSAVVIRSLCTRSKLHGSGGEQPGLPALVFWMGQGKVVCSLPVSFTSTWMSCWSCSGHLE